LLTVLHRIYSKRLLSEDQALGINNRYFHSRSLKVFARGCFGEDLHTIKFSILDLCGRISII